MSAEEMALVPDGQDYDPNEHEVCYIFSPDSPSVVKSQRPRKRRKVSRQSTTAPEPDGHAPCGFVPLLNGTEKQEFVDLRRRCYLDGWAAQKDGFDEILQNVNATTLDDIASFVDRASPSNYDDRIPTGLIVAGPSIASHQLLFQQIADRISAANHGSIIILKSGDGSNLKTILKKVIRDATEQEDSDQEEDQIGKPSKGNKVLNYDLQILHDHILKRKASRVVVAFQDSEAFDSALLTELLCLFNSWLDRIPFVVLFGIATSVEIFHEKLPRIAIRCLRGEQFDVERAEEALERFFNNATGTSAILRPGRSLGSMLLHRQKDHVQSMEAFISAVKYSYMAHFFANPLSIFVSPNCPVSQLQAEHFEALRNLKSFKALVEAALEENDTTTVQSLLDDDEPLLAKVLQSRKQCNDVMSSLFDVIKVIGAVQSCLAGKTYTPNSEMYIKAVSGELLDSLIIGELLASVKRMSSDDLTELLNNLSTFRSGLLADLVPIQQKLQSLIEETANDSKPFRSEYDLRHQTMRTTVIAQKVELSMQKSSISEQESTYSGLVQRVHSTLQIYFSTNLATNPQSLFCHELFFYDLKAPHRDAFAPKPRFAIERALSTPHDYLNCTCCATGEGLSATQPPTAILYQLYLESGSLINVFDLWSAFYTIVGGEGGEDCDERNALVLFYRALAELKQMGMIKHSRKKTDHIAKLAWKGL
ncbi:MAG: hypothetical protein M1837_003433 [Sclerophora amabilis]|nr:MAG: hypothetical protein M1837_003433 [Sclerophora amabilis]